MMKIKQIKTGKEEECDLVSEIKVENEEIQMEDLIFMKKDEVIEQGQQSGPKTIGILESENQHHMASERSEEFISCSICSKVFKRKHQYNFNAHMRVHSDERPFQCHLCPKRYKQKGILKKHLLTYHTGYTIKRDKPKKPYFPCEQCPKVFRGKLQLVYHIDGKHTKCICPICGKISANRDCLRTHMYTHSRPLLQCHLCPMIYKRKEIFLFHLFEIHEMTKEAAVESLREQNMRHKEGTTLKI